jgi:hypothetical protein
MFVSGLQASLVLTNSRAKPGSVPVVRLVGGDQVSGLENVLLDALSTTPW